VVDPELLGPLLRRYQDAVAIEIGRFGGFVAKFMGDGVLAYFGFPQAFEDAAERAVRAALGMLAEVGGVAGPDGAALDAYEEPDVDHYLPEIWRLRRQCLLALDRANKVEARRAFQSARSIARRRGAVIFERRAEASLAAVARA
jgi:hypothetical protein